MKAADLAMLRSLGQIIEHMRAVGEIATAVEPASVAVAVATTATATVPAATIAPQAAPVLDLEAVMISIVAEKTGYPKEMLGAHMELEADLGIDSIKRVEILSALRERVPHLPELKAAELALLRTLGQIVDKMRVAGGAAFAVATLVVAPFVSAAIPDAPNNDTDFAPAARTAQVFDLETLMMSIVAEKTGYPQEMLGMHMALEADLGIDSIKRVEILSALRERAPNLPEVKATELALLRTLGQIVSHMRAAGEPVVPVASSSPVASNSSVVERFAVREVPASPVGLALAGIFDAQRLVVTDDGAGISAAVVASLANRGIKANVVATVPADADAVVFLGGLRTLKTIDDAVAVNREAFHASRMVAARLTREGGAFVTVQDTNGNFGLSGHDATRAFLGGISALARTASLEWPKAAVKAIDIERGTRDAEALGQAIVNELLDGGSTLEVGLHADGRRTTLATVMTQSPTVAVDNIDSNAVVVASGGGRGVTAAALIALAKAKQPRIVLLGRTALGDEAAQLRGISDDAGLKRALLQHALTEGRKPTPAELNTQVSKVFALREIRATMAALNAAGSETRYISVDVTNRRALDAALKPVRKEWGPITAVVHGAGVLADKRIEEKTDQQFDRVFDTKVNGLRALLAATAKDPLTALCMFSSVAARTGNPGQCDYAMANEVLNLVACAERARRGASCVVRAIGWGPWEGGMVTPSLKSHFEQMGVALIPLAVGAQRFVDELVGSSDDVSVVIGGSNGLGALGAAVMPQATVQVRVDQHSHPQLADHRIAGTPVVPMVLAVEWFLRAARACRPDLVLSTVKQVRVLRGIKLEGFADAGDCFTINAKLLSSGAGADIGVELRGNNNTLHYSAVVGMTARAVAVPDHESAPSLDVWKNAKVYDGHVLFHGPRFQVIESVQGISRDGIVGTLSGTQKSAWPNEAWRSDVAAMDGGLQLALLWSRHVLGGAVLPMATGEYRSYRDGLTEGPMQCVVHGRKIHDQRTVCDISFSDASGQMVAQLIGVETVLRPGETKTTTTHA